MCVSTISSADTCDRSRPREGCATDQSEVLGGPPEDTGELAIYMRDKSVEWPNATPTDMEMAPV